MTFGGFAAKGSSNANISGVITSRNDSVSNQYTTPKYAGWQILESYVANRKNYVTKLIHAGAPENFIYNNTESGDGPRAEYILSNGNRGNNKLKSGTYLNARNWDMYKDKNLYAKGYIKEVHLLTYDEAKKLLNDTTKKTGAWYWLATGYGGGPSWSGDPYWRSALWGINENGNMGLHGGHCAGIRPVITLNSGVYIKSGNGTEENPYVLTK